MQKTTSCNAKGGKHSFRLLHAYIASFFPTYNLFNLWLNRLSPVFNSYEEDCEDEFC